MSTVDLAAGLESLVDLDDHALAGALATTAGEILLEHRFRLQQERAGQWEIKDSGDAIAHRFLAAALGHLRPDDALLSEEGFDSRARLSADRVWIVDPLDGTQEYGEGRGDWAVHVALWSGDALTAGAVALPVAGRTFTTEPAAPLPPRGDGPPRLVTSRNRAPYAAVIVANALGCRPLRLGSAGAKAMAVLMGEADIYVHDGGMHQWDSAAPAAVALASGLHASRIDGSPLVYNAPDTWLPDFIVCRPELAGDVLEALWGTDPR